MKRNHIASAVAAALLGVALGAGLFALESAMPRLALAQDHAEGGHDSGSSGGHDSGGHEGGKGGSGGHEEGGSGGKGGEHGMHGTRPGHKGHVSGVHGAGGESASPHGATDRRFGGGSGIATLDAVPEGPGYNYGPGPQFQLRYWGGWNIPADLVSPVQVVEAAPLGTGGGGGGPALSLAGADRCEGVGGQTSAAKRIDGRNLSRINGVHALVVGNAVQPEKVAPFLIANFQEEMEKAKPDVRLAGVYLGTVASQPVTPDTVLRAGAALCVSVDAKQAEAIAAAAEEQRVGKVTVRVSATAGAKP